MLPVLIIFLVTCAALIALVFIKPAVYVKGRFHTHKISIFWTAPLLGAVTMVLSGLISPREVFDGLTQAGDVNPLKILLLFFWKTRIQVFNEFNVQHIVIKLRYFSLMLICLKCSIY